MVTKMRATNTRRVWINKNGECEGETVHIRWSWFYRGRRYAQVVFDSTNEMHTVRWNRVTQL